MTDKELILKINSLLGETPQIVTAERIFIMCEAYFATKAMDALIRYKKDFDSGANLNDALEALRQEFNDKA